jgi:peptidoglycan hydrolase-like protein with peptidoglycan-binding domain
MGVVAARLVFLAFFGLTGCIIYNALYLQEGHGLGGGASVTPARQAASEPAPPAPPRKTANLPPATTDLPPLPAGVGSSKLVVTAVQRELAARGFDVGAVDGKLSGKTRAAIAAYQGQQGMLVTGLATDELLRQILLGDSIKPSAATTGSLETSDAGDGEDRASTVKAVQQILTGLGYDPGPVDGKLGGATSRAISTFQRDRKIPDSGRITPELLREMKRVTGRDLTKTAAHP